MARQIDPLYEAAKFKHESWHIVRFADLDALGHVNHAKYLTYMEQARMEYAAAVWGWTGIMTDLTMIVAHAEVNYLAPLFLNDRIKVMTRTARLGTKSFDLAYLMQRQEEDGNLINVATGKTAMVMYDYDRHITIPFREDWRSSTLTYETALSST